MDELSKSPLQHMFDSMRLIFVKVIKTVHLEDSVKETLDVFSLFLITSVSLNVLS